MRDSNAFSNINETQKEQKGGNNLMYKILATTILLIQIIYVVFWVICLISRDGQVCAKKLQIMGYGIAILTLAEILATAVQAKYERVGSVINHTIVGQVILGNIVFSIIILWWICTQIFFFGATNNCSEGWLFLYIMIIIFIVEIYLTFILVCCSAFLRFYFISKSPSKSEKYGELEVHGL